MAHVSPLALVFRAHATTNDPTAVGYIEHTVYVSEAPPKRKPEGEEEEFLGGELEAPDTRRIWIPVDPYPLTREAQVVGAELQDYGVSQKLDELFCYPFVWLFAVIEVGFATIQRAGSHLSSVSGANDLWTGILPFPCVLDGEIDPQFDGNGLYDWPFTIKGRRTL